MFHRRWELLKITLTHHVLWIGSFYIQLLDPVYFSIPISETTVEADKGGTFKYTKLAVKTVKCYWYYWIIQDLEATLELRMQFPFTVECLDVVHFLSKNIIFTKKTTKFCLAALTSAYILMELTFLKSAVDQLTVCRWEWRACCTSTTWFNLSMAFLEMMWPMKMWSGKTCHLLWQGNPSNDKNRKRSQHSQIKKKKLQIHMSEL